MVLLMHKHEKPDRPLGAGHRNCYRNKNAQPEYLRLPEKVLYHCALFEDLLKMKSINELDDQEDKLVFDPKATTISPKRFMTDKAIYISELIERKEDTFQKGEENQLRGLDLDPTFLILHDWKDWVFWLEDLNPIDGPKDPQFEMATQFHRRV